MRNNKIKTYAKVIILTLASILFYGCATERTVQDNRFYSSSPKMLLIVDKEFTYIGSESFEEITPDADEPKNENRKGRADVDYYLFVFQDSHNATIKKGINIIIHKMPTSATSWVSTLIDKDNDLVRDHGMILQGGEYYEVATMSSRISDNAKKWFAKKSLKMSNCVIKKVFSQKVDNRTIKEIEYFEDAEDSGFGCKEWDKMKLLSSKPVKYLEGFEKRADKAIQINSVAQD
jgi:hypothetical protein